jgi:hypothetical protein
MLAKICKSQTLFFLAEKDVGDDMLKSTLFFFGGKSAKICKSQLRLLAEKNVGDLICEIPSSDIIHN